jgi:hypothetical protein
MMAPKRRAGGEGEGCKLCHTLEDVAFYGVLNNVRWLDNLMETDERVCGNPQLRNLSSPHTQVDVHILNFRPELSPSHVNNIGYTVCKSIQVVEVKGIFPARFS